MCAVGSALSPGALWMSDVPRVLSPQPSWALQTPPMASCVESIHLTSGLPPAARVPSIIAFPGNLPPPDLMEEGRLIWLVLPPAPSRP